MQFLIRNYQPCNIAVETAVIESQPVISSTLFKVSEQFSSKLCSCPFGDNITC